LPLPPQLCVLFVERIRLGLSPQKQKLPDCVPAKKKFREAQVARHFALVIVVDRVTEPERSLELIFFGTRELGDSAVPVSAKHPKAPFGFAGCATASGLMHTAAQKTTARQFRAILFPSFRNATRSSGPFKVKNLGDNSIMEGAPTQHIKARAGKISGGSAVLRSPRFLAFCPVRQNRAFSCTVRRISSPACPSPPRRSGAPSPRVPTPTQTVIRPITNGCLPARSNAPLPHDDPFDPFPAFKMFQPVEVSLALGQ